VGHQPVITPNPRKGLAIAHNSKASDMITAVGVLLYGLGSILAAVLPLLAR
jgi:hypothetical protein